MTVPPPTAPLSREEKQALLRARLVQRMSQPRTEVASFAQERLWFLERMNGASALYNVPEALRLRGALDVAALERALGGIVRRHETLRTTLREVDGAPVQVIAPFAGFALPVEDLSALPAEAREAGARRHAADDAALPFDLEQGPLFRARLLRLGDDDHVLLLCMHHVVTDGWSAGVLHRELAALYAAFLRGEPDPLPPLPIQYADYAARHRRVVDGDVLEAQAAYWTRTLAGAPELLELPADRPRPPRQDIAGASVDVALDPALSDALQSLSQRHGTTLFMTLLAGWAVVLARLSGQDDVVVGTPSANRDRAEVEGLIGFFINTLAVRVDLSDGPRVDELLERVRTRALEAQRHQDIPFEQVVERLRPVRSRAYTPLFQVMFAWQNAPGGDLHLPGLEVADAEAGDADTAKFDLSLSLWEQDGRITGTLRYATALFDRGTVERFADYLRRVLAAMAADDAARVDGIPLLPPAERARVVEAWNATDTAYPSDACIHALFQAQAARTPGATAVSHEGERVTYAELNARANRLAHHLRRRGVGPEVRVALCMERGVDLVVCMLAILKAGGAWVPLDPAHPAERLRRMLADSGAAVLLTQDRLRAALPATAGLDVLPVDAEAPAIAAESAENPESGATPRGLAYVIYTSGSTGTPKGVGIEHRALVNHMAWFVRDFGLTGGDRVLQKTPVVFDASAWEFHAPLLVGGELVMARHEGERDPRYLARTLRDRGITVLQLVPSLLRVLLDEPELAECTSLRHLFCGGEPLPGELARRAARVLPDVPITNLYGPAECCIDTSTHRCTAADGERAVVPIGRPVSNTRSYVLDAALRPVPVGVPGELCIGGVQVGRGYLGRAALTAETFVPDPFGAAPGARLYRTGDRVRWRECVRAEARACGSGADGDDVPGTGDEATDGGTHARTAVLEFLGRADFQVKIRGVRIEPGEIEAALRGHPAVRDAVVLARADAPGEARLVAYVVGQVDAEALRAHVAERVPVYMVPAAYVRLERLPLTPNGKLDRRALPAPEGDAFAARGYEPPAGETEQAVAGIWAELLGAERVGRGDDFFALGGHSLMAMRVVSRVRQALGVDVSPGDLFERPVLADFARGLTAAAAQADVIEPVDRTGAIPLSFAQQRLWFLEQLGNLGSTYHVPLRLRLKGALDRDALVRALARIVARHEALRTTFPAVDGEPVQRIASIDQSAFRLIEHDLTRSDDAEDALRRRMADEAGAAFDLARGPLFRGRLVRMGADDHVLLLTMHHIVSDGWSAGVLHRELGALYAAFARGDADPLPPLAIQYADYAAWHRRAVDGEVLEAQAAYWTRTLAGAPELLELPADRPRPPRQDFAGASLGVALDAGLTDALKSLSQRHGTTLFMTLLAGWAAVLARLSGQGDVVVGTVSANRGRAEVEALIGFFINTLPVRVDLSDGPTVAQLLERVRTQALEAQRNQDIPFEQIVERLSPTRSLAYSPLVQVMFAWQNAPGGDLQLPGLTVADAEAGDADTAKFDLSLTLWEQDGRIVGGLNYATALFDRATVERVSGYLRHALQAMAADAHRAVDRLPLLPDAERRQVVDTWNATERPYPAGLCVHDLFRAQAARTPDAVALVHGGERLTYAALEARANRIGHALRRQGVGPEVRVGICLPRTPDLLAAMLGVLGAGGAYVPLDPAYPRERLGYMLQDAAISLVITDSALADRLPEGPAALLLLDRERDALALEPTTAPASGAVPENLSHVIFTSGSTGRPKGVMIRHASVVVLLHWLRETVTDAERASVLFSTSINFDVSVAEIFGTLCWGGTLVLVENALELATLDEPVVHVSMVPSAAAELLRSGGIPASVRTLNLGGEALPNALAQGLYALPTVEKVGNLYGPTEDTTYSTYSLVPRGAEQVLVGRPVANTRAYVLDAHLQPVPVGVAGELYLAGDGLSRGYARRPGMTAERFLPCPFGPAGSRMYRVMDRVRRRADGELDYLGRTDFQVKVRGFRIELGEIEARLAEHPDVHAAVVLVREDTPGDRRLVAYVVGDADADALRAHSAERLPAYMVPAAYVRLDAFPLTPNGKVDRKALPAPEGDAFGVRGYEAPVGEAEQAVAAIWAELLGVERVGRGDDFFALGGHSLLAIRVVSRVRQALGVDVSAGDVFERAVLADFARGLTTDAGAASAPIEPVDRTGPIALSFAQQRLWFLEQLDNLGSTYHIPLRLRLRGDLDRAALVRALDRIVARHEALRTTFPAVDGEPVQRITSAEESGFRLVEHDLTRSNADDADDAENQLRRLMADEASAAFDLEHGPLIRGRLIRLAPDDHVLLMTMHHIVSDGWSAGVLHRELGALYAAFLRGEADPLPPLPIQYADYAAWHRQLVDGDVLEAQAAYWSQTLAGAPELLELPTDRPRPRRQDFAGASLDVELDASLTQALRTLSHRHGTTLFMTLLAGWAAVLARLSGQGDVVVGTPTANRARSEVEELIGFFVNTLPVRVDLSDGPTVAQLLERVRTQALEAQRNQDIPLEQIVERLSPTRSLAYSPVFQVTFAWQNAVVGDLRLPGLTVGHAGDAEMDTAKFDLSLALWESGGRIVGGVTYARSLFERATVERYAGYFRRVLRAMAADDTARMDAIPLLAADEHHRVVRAWNDTVADFPRGVSLPELFEAQAARTPDADALVWGDESLSFAELNVRANRLAHHLVARGVGPDARVALCLERGPDALVGFVAVLKAGGAYVPLDPSYPVARLREMLDDSRPVVLLTQASLVERVGALGVPAIALDLDAGAWAQLPEENPARPGLTPEHLAYVIYTSGSTGRPKGVMVRQGSVVNLATALQARIYDAHPAPLRVGVNAPLVFDGSVKQVVQLLAGHALCVVPDAVRRDPAALVAWLRRERVDALDMTPSLLRLALDEGLGRDGGFPRLVLVGGEAVDEELRGRMLGVPTRFYNVYGPTECTVDATAVEIGAAGPASSIGAPLPNVTAYVLDPRLNPVPVGVAGELYVGGAGVARGYLGRPGQTAERFVPDPFASERGSRLYRTGDRVRWVERAGGTDAGAVPEPLPHSRTPALTHSRTPALTHSIEYLGRLDVQVKVRGFRIELGEIEARLLEQPDVRDAVVLAREDAPGATRLVAYVTGDAPDAETLRAHLAEHLPEYMIPAAYVRLDALPLTPNGKIDRRALPAPDGDALAARAYQAPVGTAEQAVAAIWSEMLGAERVGRGDDFFALGGHSLLAVRVVWRVRQALGVDVSPGDLFERPVLADFARGLATAARAEAPAIEPVDHAGEITASLSREEKQALLRARRLHRMSQTRTEPASFAQERLWFLERMNGASALYNVPQALRLRGALDVAALERALGGIVRRHETLRTTLREVDGAPVQVIAPFAGFALPVEDLSALPAEAREAGARRHAADDAALPFDLEQGPLFRARLLRLADDHHVLLLCMHHVVTDGWSVGVLHRELAALYAAFLRGEPDPLPLLPIQYADYAAWHRRSVEGAVLEAQAAYWTRTLAGAPELLELPADRPRPARQDFSGASVAVELDAALSDALKSLSQRHGTTLFMTLLAGWAAVLARLSGQDDVVVGTPSANRGRAETENLIGFFINTLPVRVELADGPRVDELLERVRTRALEAQRHQDIPFDQVVERLRPTRSRAYSPLFQVMFAWQNAAGGALELPGLAVAGADAADAADAADDTAKFDLSLALWEEDGRIAGRLTYATALFERSTIERFAGYLRRALAAMAADEHQPVDRLPLLAQAEHRLVVHELNATDRPYPAACIHDLFRAQAARTPDAVALVWRGERMTYGELERRANRIAHALRRRGAGPEVCVGICLPRTPDLVAALLGVLGAGAAYVPLDPAYPRERLGWMMEDAAIALVVTDSALADRLPEGTAARLLLDRERAALAAEPDTAPESGVAPENLSHVIFTSGSTGRPKGVMIRHSAVAVLLHWMRDTIADDERASVLFSTSVNFDVSVAELFGALCWGGTLVMVENALDLPAVADQQIRYVSMVPTAAAELLRTGGIPASVRTVNLAGEALPGELARALYALGTVEQVRNLYGPTEDTSYSTCSVVARGAEPVLIGTPLANARAYVLDRQLQPVPLGAAGELYLAGDGLARGYANRPAMTAERFLPCPFGAPGGRMYRVMDRVRRRADADGALEYLGRTDFQVKVRGFRIELGEIEARLVEHPEVHAAVVVAREHAPGDTRLVAYVAADETVSADLLRAHLAERLPAYMVPAAYVRLDTLPRTPNGKVDRKALPAPGDHAFARRGYEAPVGDTEAVLAEIWAEVLGAERVGRGDDFFELGGHSLLAVRLVSRVRQALDVDVSLGDLFERPVLADFARGLATAARARATAIVPVDRGAPIPPSFAQQRLWFLEQLDGTGGAYHIPMGLRLRGVLDRAALGRALDRIVARHESLRTTFPAIDGEPVQRIASIDQSAFRLVEHDLDAAADAEDVLGRLMADEAGAPFDLVHGPLVRGRLVRVAADDHVLLVTMHHIVSDGWSMGVFARELGALYGAFARGQADPLPPLPAQYADYAAWQRRWVDGELLERQAAFWERSLAGAPELLELPTDRARPRRQDFAGASLPIELDAEVTAALKALSRRHGTTLFMTLLAGWATVLGRLAGQADVVVGTPTAGRERGETQALIGFFVQTLALRVDLSGGPTVAELLTRVRARALQAQQHQDIPFEQVVERVRPARSLAHHPLFQVLFAWQGTPGEPLALPGLTAGDAAEAAQRTAKFDLSLTLWEEDGRIAGGLNYATALFDRATVQRFARYLRRALREMAADENQPVDRLALLPPDERARVLDEWNRTEAAYPAACVHELLAAQAARTPDAVAVECEGETVTYAELDARANRLANHLRRLGVGPETRVGVCAERSPELVVALLGVLKAGGAYVPVDPGYPAERLAHMLGDSGVPVLLTQASLANSLPPHGARVVRLDADGPRIAAESDQAPRVHVDPAGLAYVIYTSGSTGRPKGAMNAHRGIVNRLLWMQAQYGLDASDVVLQKTPFSFDVSVWEFFWPLMTGARLVLARPGAHGDPAYLARLIERAGVTTLHFVPSMLQAFLDAGAVARCGSLRRVICSGEALSYELMERAMDALPWAGIHNLYGPTEAAVDVTYCAAERRERRIVPIGRPVANTRILVLDGALGPVPAGVAGELYIGGVQVGRGYLGRPATTAERFVPDPFAADAGARMYRTGDRARWTADGEIEYLGRADFQVKVRGFRIELGEIEARLLEHPAVHAAAVVARDDAAGGKQLVAYCVADGAVEVEGLRAHLSERLPEYMVPAAYVRLQTLPLSPNGKLDRNALPAPADDAYTRHDFEAPVGETEQALAEIWAELLGLARVGRRDDFFDLGGHSLLAARVAARVSERFGRHVSATAVFLHPTLDGLAQAVDDARASQSAPPAAHDGPLDGGMGSDTRSVDLLSDDDVDAMLAALLSKD